jgi:hypothetical protein
MALSKAENGFFKSSKHYKPAGIMLLNFFSKAITRTFKDRFKSLKPVFQKLWALCFKSYGPYF